MSSSDVKKGPSATGTKPTFVFKRSGLATTSQKSDPAPSLIDKDVTLGAAPNAKPSSADRPGIAAQGSVSSSSNGSSLFAMHSLVETSLRLENALHSEKSTALLSPEAMLKRKSDKKRWNTLTSLDSAVSTQILGYEASHEGYLTFVTLSLMNDTPEHSRDHFFSSNMTEADIRSRYLLPTSMESTLLSITQNFAGDDYLLEKMASNGVQSAEDMDLSGPVVCDPFRSSLRRMDEIYQHLTPKFDSEDLREMIRANNFEDEVKRIKKRQRPADPPTPHYRLTSSVSSPSPTPSGSLISTKFDFPEMPSMLRGPASKKRRLFVEGCIPAIEYRFVDMEFHEDEELDLHAFRADTGNRNWMLISKREIPRVASIWIGNYQTKRENAAILARAARDAVLARVEQAKKKALRSQSKAKFLSRSIYAFIKKNEKEWRRQADREAEAIRKEEQDVVDKDRAAKKLNFLITQTELYSHFMSKKLGIQAAEDEMEKLKTGESTTAAANGAVSQLNPEEEDQMKRAKEEALIAYKTQRAKIDSFDHHSAKMRGSSGASHSASTVHGPRKTGGIVTQNMPPTSANADPQSSLIEQPRDLLCKLKPYQVKGLNWLNNLYEQGINGILADEMGLGKTVQTISMLGHLAETRGIWGPFIVIAPTSTLPNWANEFAKFYPSFKVLPYYGTAKQRASLRKVLNSNYLHRPDSVVHVVVTSYNLVVHDEKYISRIHWEYMILDEAHAIKSASSVRWQTLLGFANTRNRLLLTGTPIQNNMAELWALLHFIMPTLFDSHNEFAEWFSKDIEEHAAGTASLNEHQLTRLHMILKPFMLRRVKVDVQNELPSKTEIQVRCDMTARQRTLYNGIRNHMSIHDLFDRINLPTGKAAQERQAKTLMNIVMQFRNVCNHPEILDRSEAQSPLQFSQPVPPVVSYGTILATANTSWIQFQLPKLVYEETLMDLDPRIAGTHSDQPTRQKWLRHRFNIFSQLHTHSSIFRKRFESGGSNASPSSCPSIIEVTSASATPATLYPSQPMTETPAKMMVDSVGSPSSTLPTPTPTKRSFKDILSSKRSPAPEPDQTTAVPIQTESPLSTSSPAPQVPLPPNPTGSKEDLTRICYSDHDSTSHADLHCWDFVRLMDSCPSEIEWISQAASIHRWMAVLASRDRDRQLADIEDKTRKSTTSLLRIVPVSSPVALHVTESFCAMNDLARLDPLRRLSDELGCVKATWATYRPRVWSAPQSLYCSDRRFTFYHDQLEHDKYITRMLLGTARDQSGPEDLFRQVSSVRLKAPSFPMAMPLLSVFGSNCIQVPQYSELVRDSGKLKKLDELLKELKRGGHRVLVYSQFTEVLDLLEEFMFVRGHKFVRLDGSSKLDDRRDMVDAFQMDPSLFIFLLSTRAGGLGINLTAADTVIFYDSDWNPTMDSQAMDRAHRLGQTRPVTVYRLITKNSIEERILQRAKQKGMIQNLVIQGGRFNLSPDEADDIFKPSEMMDLLLDDEQLDEMNKTETAKRKKTIINPIKLGIKRSAKPPKPADKSSATAPKTLTMDESISSSAKSEPTQTMQSPVSAPNEPVPAHPIPPPTTNSSSMDVDI